MSIYKYYADFNNSVFQVLDYALFGILAIAAISYYLICKAKYPKVSASITKLIRSLFFPEFRILVLLFVWYFLCCISVGDHYGGNWLKGNMFPLFDTAISFFILFPLAFYLNNSGNTRVTIHACIHLLVGIMTILMAIVLWNVFHLNILEIPGGQIGMTSEVRLCINCHPNTAGAYAALILMLCLYMLVIQPYPVKILYAVSIIIHLFILMLTNSRTCFIAVTLCYSLTAGFVLWHSIGSRPLIQRCIFSLVSASLTLIAFFTIRDGVFNLFESVTHFSEHLALQNSSSIRALDMGSGEMDSRYILWSYSLKSMVSDWHKAIWGVTPISVISAISLASNGKYSEWYTHNQFLEVGVALGWVGLILFILFMLLMAKNCLRIGLSQKQYPFSGFYIVPMIILMLVISNLTEAILLFYHFLSGGVFFLLCGWVTLESHNSPDTLFNLPRKNRMKQKAKQAKKK